MRGILEPEHLLFILLVVLVLFGGKKIPELAGGLGKGIREFKRGMEDGVLTGVHAEPPATESRAFPAIATPDAEPDRTPKRLL